MKSEEQNIIFDNIYEDIALRLDYALDEVIEEIEEDWEIGGEMVIDSKLAGKKCLIAQGKDCQYFDKIVVPGIINE